MRTSLSQQDRGVLLRECVREEALARDAERRATRRGDYAEAEYWYAKRMAWMDKATALLAGK